MLAQFVAGETLPNGEVIQAKPGTKLIVEQARLRISGGMAL
jgi:hypothetical protein